jgi:hypothetical protein
MNRIILIGNGFDLAHDLETSYKHFIDWLWNDLAKKLKDKNRTTWNYEDDIFVAEGRINYSQDGNTDYENLLLSKENGGINYDSKNIFLKILTEKTSQLKWVDIEEEYYQQIKNILQQNSKYYKDDKGGEKETAIMKLNRDFEIIKQKLKIYLSEIVSKKITEIESMHYIFSDSFKYQDFPDKKKILLFNILKNSRDNYYKYGQDKLDRYYEHYLQNYKECVSSPPSIDDMVTSSIGESWFNDSFFGSIYPINILVLNFNYTKTDYVYSNYVKKMNSPNLPSFNIIPINIHGELKNENNPIIFGYGDELADEYKELEKNQDKEYFKNIKSIKYLKTNNYRQLLNFADSDYFQVYTLGHSCGNSDRTLLNTLFEHDNCVSIKPFFYEKEAEDGTKIDDYEEIVINISRNFKDKKTLRERVVNKTDCSPLPQIKKES